MNESLLKGGGSPIPPPESGIVGPFYLPSPEQLKKDFESLSSVAGEATAKLRDISELPLSPGAFFSEDWKNYSRLPLVDRRSGKDRRKNPDAPEFLEGRRDRRSGQDRRKVDRFREREEFLKEKTIEKLKSEALEAQVEKPPSLSDVLAPYLPPVPSKLELPGGMDLRNSELQHALEEASHEPPPKMLLPDPAPQPQARLPEPEPPKAEEDWAEETSPEWFTKTEEILKKEVTLPEPLEERPSDPTKLDLPEAKTPELPTEELPPKIELPEPIDPSKAKDEVVVETEDPLLVELVGKEEEDLKIGLPDPEDPNAIVVEGNLEELGEEEDLEDKIEEEPDKVIHGVLELKPPEADDAPFLTLTYDFNKIPHAFRLSKNYSIMEYSYYKYKPMLLKAQEFARRKMLKNALNYYRVIKSQNIPPELRKMINRNIRDITEFMEKFLMAKGN